MSDRIFRKWRQWLRRICDDQLRPLLVQQHMFSQLTQCTSDYAGTYQGVDLARWIEQGYIAVACTCVRRMTEERPEQPRTLQCPKCAHRFPVRPSHSRNRSVSLVMLLQELLQHVKANPNSLTIEWFRKGWKTATLANREFARIMKNRRVKRLTDRRIKRDLKALKDAAKPIRLLVNTQIAHTAFDRRHRPRVRYARLERALRLLVETFKRYFLLIEGDEVILDIAPSQYRVMDDLRKVWPHGTPARVGPGGHP